MDILLKIFIFNVCISLFAFLGVYILFCEDAAKEVMLFVLWCFILIAIMSTMYIAKYKYHIDVLSTIIGV